MATLLTNSGRALLVTLALLTGSQPKYLGWGTGAGTTAATDTTLFSEKALDLATTTGTRPAGTASAVTTSVSGDTIQVTGTMTMTGTGPVNVTNAGLFDNSTIGSGNMLLKGDFTAVPLNNGDSIAFTHKLQFT